MTSAADLVTFGRAMVNGGVGPNGARILSAASAARMGRSTTAAFAGLPDMRVGLGWLLLPGGVLTHGSGGPGVRSVLYAHPGSGRVVVLLTNCDKYGPLQTAVIDPILESWTGIKKRIQARENGSVESKPYEGVYENNIQRLKVFCRDAGLYLRLSTSERLHDNSPIGDEQPATRLYPLGNHAFEAEAKTHGLMNFDVRFVQPAPDGRMQFLALGVFLLRRTK